MIQGQSFHFVERDQYPSQKRLVLFLQRQSKTIDDRAEDF